LYDDVFLHASEVTFQLYLKFVFAKLNSLDNLVLDLSRSPIVSKIKTIHMIGQTGILPVCLFNDFIQGTGIYTCSGI
jgi:hypothetical protein